MKILVHTLLFFLLVTQICFGQWVQTNGVFGSHVNCFLGNGTDLFAGTSHDGIFLSTNNGESWNSVNEGLPKFSYYYTDTIYYVSINCLAMSGENLFAGTSNGVFLTTNNGISWIKVNNNGLPLDNGVNDLVVLDTHLFASTPYSGVFQTTTNGTYWTSAGTGLPTNSMLQDLAVSGSNIFAGTDNDGVFISTNNGTNWIAVNEGLPKNNYDTTKYDGILCFAISGTNLFVGTSGGVYQSTNNGMTWIEANSGLSDTYVGSLVAYNGNLFAAMNSGVFISTNNGTSWSPVNNGLLDPYASSIGVSDTNLFVQTESGVFRSTNGGTNWILVSNGISSVANVGALIARGTDLFVGIGSGGREPTGCIYLSTDNGASWIPKKHTGTPVIVLFQYDNALFAGTGSKGLYRSTDGGEIWAETNNGLPQYSHIHSMVVSGSNLFVGTYDGVFLSTDNGTNWVSANNGLTDYNVRALAVSGANLFAGTEASGVFLSTNNGINWVAVNEGLPRDNYDSTRYAMIYCITSNGQSLFAGTYYHGVFRSTNNGTNWVAANQGLPKHDFDSTLYMTVLCFASSEQIIFAGTDGGVFLTTNNGTNWTSVSSGLVVSPVSCLTLKGTNLFAGTGYYSPLGGGHGTGIWKRPLSEMAVPVELIAFTATANGKEVTLSWSTATELNNQGFEVQRKFSSNNFVTIGSVRGHGTTTSPNNYTYIDKLIDAGKYFYRLKQIDYGGKYECSNEIEVEVTVVGKFGLWQNYPNPFNPKTKISWHSPVSGKQALKIFDVLGNEIATLVNKEMEVDNHSIDFDGSELPSGVYFYQLRAGSFVETKKMILLR